MRATYPGRTRFVPTRSSGCRDEPPFIRLFSEEHETTLGAAAIETCLPIALNRISWKHTPIAARRICVAHQDFEALADQLANDLSSFLHTVPALSDYAVSRAGIYEDHP